MMNPETRISDNRAASFRTVGGVFLELFRHPVTHLIHKWNWKSALFSSTLRGSIFFLTNLTAGFEAATSAMFLEFGYRAMTAGFYGALTQAFRKVENRTAGMIAAILFLPAVQHTLEFFVHWIGGTAEIQRSIQASVCFTAFSTSFNVFAMRQGVLVVGQDEKSLREDMKRIPDIIFAYLSSLISIIVYIRDTLVSAHPESLIRACSSLRAGNQRLFARLREIRVCAETYPGTSRKKTTPKLRKRAIFGRKLVRWLYTSHRRPIRDLVNNRKMEELTSE